MYTTIAGSPHAHHMNQPNKAHVIYIHAVGSVPLEIPDKLILVSQISGIIYKSQPFCAWLIALNMLSKLIHIVTWMNGLHF